MTFELRGKTALVTGASSGIGWATAKALAAAGAAVGVSGRTEDALTQLALQIRADGGTAQVLTADLSRRGAAADLARRARARLGPIDVLVNNAAGGMIASQWNGGDGDVGRAMMETNYWSPLALIAELVPEMCERRSGVVVNVTVPLAMLGHYESCKAALTTATEAMRVELEGAGVGVLLVLPGPVGTPMLAEPRELDGLDGLVTVTAPGTAADLARRIVRGVRRGAREIVYPRSLWSGRLFSWFARWRAASEERRRRESSAKDLRVT